MGAHGVPPTPSLPIPLHSKPAVASPLLFHPLRPELAVKREHPIPIKRVTPAAPQSAARGRLSRRSAALAPLPCVPNAPSPR